MKRKYLKTISAMALTLTLSAAALAGTVQAAGGNERAACTNHNWDIKPKQCRSMDLLIAFGNPLARSRNLCYIITTGKS